MGANNSTVVGGSVTAGAAIVEKSHHKLQSFLQDCLFSGIPVMLTPPEISEPVPASEISTWQVVELENCVEEEGVNLEELQFGGVGGVGAVGVENCWVNDIS
jgi:hypothetical protein